MQSKEDNDGNDECGKQTIKKKQRKTIAKEQDKNKTKTKLKEVSDFNFTAGGYLHFLYF